MNRDEPYLSTYLHARGRKLGLPVAGNFELTARCNFGCPMCYVHNCGAASERELTASQWLELAGQARDRGMIFVLLTGGEPFIRSDFFDIYRGLKEMGLLISINSNGSLLSGEILDRLAEDPPFRINISLYGASNETYEKMCGLPYFDRVVENIRAVRERGIEVRLNSSLTPYNCHDLEGIFETSKKLGVHLKASGYMYPQIRLDKEPGEGNRMSAEEAALYSVKYDMLRFTPEEFRQRAANIKTGIVEREDCKLEAAEEGVGCRAGSSSFWMTWDGKMLPCGMMKAPVAYPLEVGFEAAWQEILRETKAIRLPSACSSCAKRNLCCVCAAVCAAETGDYQEIPSYACRMTDEIIRLTGEFSETIARKDDKDHDD